MEFAFLGSPVDLAILLMVALVVFGPKRLPDVARQIGTFVRDMRKMMGQFTDAVNDVHEEFRPIIHDTQETFRSAAPKSDLMKPHDQREPIVRSQDVVVSEAPAAAVVVQPPVVVEHTPSSVEAETTPRD